MIISLGSVRIVKAHLSFVPAFLYSNKRLFWDRFGWEVCTIVAPYKVDLYLLQLPVYISFFSSWKGTLI